jgi:hypothetical protein
MLRIDSMLMKAFVPAALALTAGCAAEKDAGGDRAADAFLRPGDVSHVTRLADAQIAAGARTDATLRPYHFYDDGRLNSLGQEKLDLMAGDDGQSEGGTLVVYLDDSAAGDGAAAEKLAEARREAVTEYLSIQGLDGASFRLETGHNPNVTTSAVPMTSAAADKTGGAGGPSEAAAAFGEGFGEGLTSPTK